MATQENNPSLVGQVELNFDYRDLLTLNFNHFKHNNKYINRKAAICQDRMPQWLQHTVAGLSPNQVWTWSLKCLYPNTVIKEPAVESQKIFTVIFLDDRTAGNYFELNGVPMNHWRRGTYVAWQQPMTSHQVNFGNHNRYYLELTAES